MLTWAFWSLIYLRVHSRPCRIPLSAFIVEDMTELARAHATYRFVILDEEEERPRILVRTFS
jgi:ubiquitin-protein ligase E3 D